MKMKSVLLTLVTIFSIAATSAAFGYETETHALITAQAVKKSVLTPPDGSTKTDTLVRFGLDRLDEDARFKIYWDPNNVKTKYFMDGLGPKLGLSDFQTETPEEFERCQMAELKALSASSSIVRKGYGDLFDKIVDASSADATQPIANWIVRGAIREDDLGTIMTKVTGMNCYWAAANVKEYDPYDVNGTLVRVFNHFYDPVWDRPMPSCPDVFGCNKSVDWALGNVDSFADPVMENLSRRNRYTYRDARNAMWGALTGQPSKPTNGAPYTAVQRETDARFRMYLWATAFRSLGNVVHLLEDTAQPQHTRNDPHSVLQSLDAFGSRTAFEGYTNARVLQDLANANSYARKFFGGSDARLDPLPLGNYPTVWFSTPVRYFSTRADDPLPASDQNNSLDTRSGLADYTNRGFFTPGTLPPESASTTHPSPNPVITDTNGHPINGYQSVPTDCRIDHVRLSSATSCKHYTHAVPDTVAAVLGGYSDYVPPTQPGGSASYFASPNFPLLSDSIFSQFVPRGTYADYHAYVLSPVEMDNLANLTVPRAVGYTTGLINFFFRGQLTLSSPPDGLYGVVDQGFGHTVAAGGVPIRSDGTNRTFGFETVRVRVKNTTMVDASGAPTLFDAGRQEHVQQDMKAGIDASGHPTGYLVAVARYHRNPCYRVDLSGEWVTIDKQGGGTESKNPSGCNSVADQRTPYQEVSVSYAVPIDAQGNLPATTNHTNSPNCANVGNINTGVAEGLQNESCPNPSALVEFDFSNDPIPVNATDLFLQVVYRGPIGEEDDGIAAGTIDLLEPNYLTVFNNSDHFYLNNAWVSATQTPLPPEVLPPAPFEKAWVCFNSQIVSSLGAGQQIAPGQFIRIGVLSDDVAFKFGDFADFRGTRIAFSDGAWPGIPRQSDKENGGTFINTSDATGFPGGQRGMAYIRGTTAGWDWYTIESHNQDPPQTPDDDWEIEAFNPPIGDTSTPGIPLHVAINYSGMSDGNCQGYFGGNANLANKSLGVLKVPSSPQRLQDESTPGVSAHSGRSSTSPH